MSRTRAINGSNNHIGVALILLMAAFPAGADEISELKQQIAELARKIEQLEQQRDAAEQAKVAATPTETLDMSRYVQKGDVRNSFKIPGSETSMRIGGFVEAGYFYDIGPRPTSRGGDIASARSAVLEGTPEYENRGEARATARNSRFNIATWTPTRYGQLRTFLEGDFNGAPNAKSARATTSRTAFGIRHAYGELGNVLFGHYWSNFSDNTVFSNKVDGTGPVGRNFMRQGQLRYTFRLGDGRRLAFALENPFSDFPDADDETAADSYPDLTVHYRHQTDRWHWQTAAVLRRIGYDDFTLGTDLGDHATVWGINQSGAIKLGEGEDRISWYMAAGNGIGRYLEGGNEQAVTIDVDGNLDAQFGYGGFITFRHWWTDTLSTDVDFGYTRFRLNPEAIDEANRTLYSSHLNLIWAPLENIELGIEYVWAHRQVYDRREGSINRISANSVFYF